MTSTPNPRIKPLQSLFATAAHKLSSARTRIANYEADLSYRRDPTLQTNPTAMAGVRQSRASSVERHRARLAQHTRSLNALRRRFDDICAEARSARGNGGVFDGWWRRSEVWDRDAVEKLRCIGKELDLLIGEIGGVGMF